MSFNARYKYNQKDTGTVATTAVAAGTVIAGNTLIIEKTKPGSSVAAHFIMKVNTMSLTMTPSFQGSIDGTNWVNLFMMNSAANVATAAGTGSDVTTTRVLLTPSGVPFRFLRGVITTGGATAHASADTYSIKYHYVENDVL